MLQKILVIILFSLVGCSSMPQKPDVYLCSYFSHESKFYCAMGDRDYEIGGEAADGYIAFSPEDYKKILKYVEELKRFCLTKGGL